MKNKQIIRSHLQAVDHLFHNGCISVLLKSAKLLQPFIEKLITKGKNYHKTEDAGQKLHIRRNILKLIHQNSKKINVNSPITTNNKNKLANRIINFAGHYNNRPGGYTRIIKTIGNNSRIIGQLSMVDSVNLSDQ